MTDPGPTAPLLRFESVRIEGRTGDAWRPLAQDISFTLHRGKVLGLIGESGAGKSTIGLAALAYTRPGCRFGGGRILLDGIDLLAGRGRDAIRRLRGTRIAYVAQSAASSFNPATRLIDQCIEMAVKRQILSTQEAKARTHELFARLHIADPERFGRRYAHQVSGGQLQRAMLAMAMLCRPDIIVFDEPTTALDVTTQISVLGAVRDALALTGAAGIYISHDLALVSQIADDIIVLKDGTVVEGGPAHRIITEPVVPYTRALLARRQPILSSYTGPTIEPCLTVRGATGSYAALRVLDNVDLSIGKGQSVALVGESGSGKSTLARAIMGLFRLTEGKVVLSGLELGPLGTRGPDVLRRLQLVHQNPDTALNPRQTIGTILSRPLRVFLGLGHERPRARIRELLAEVELPAAMAELYPGALSGGQKQRVCIARALAAEPELLICDEITASLDRITADEITRLLGRLRAQVGMSTLLITHDFSLVEALADEVVVMRRGKVVETGQTASVLSLPRHGYTQRLIASIPTFEQGWLANALTFQRD